MRGDFLNVNSSSNVSNDGFSEVGGVSKVLTFAGDCKESRLDSATTAYGAGDIIQYCGAFDVTVPDGYNEKVPLGRPKEKPTDRGTQDNAFGKDPLGRKGMKNDDNESNNVKPNFKGGSPLALETKEMLKKVPIPPKTEKQLVFEQDKNKEGLLDESQLRE